MNNSLILLGILSHLLGDFYFQSNKMAENKQISLKWNIIHGVVYSVPFLIVFILIKKSLKIFNIFLIIIVTHFIIDLSKYYLFKLSKKFLTIECSSSICKYIKNFIMLNIKKWMIYIIDQVIHLVIIIYFCNIIKANVLFIPHINSILKFCNWSEVGILKWLVILLCCYKPCNITFIQLFAGYEPIRERTTENAANKDNEKAGQIIGFLERILIIIFLNLKQYSAIGLIMTAKSIARYDMISKDKKFAEYYLIGTLVSILFSIIIYYILLT